MTEAKAIDLGEDGDAWFVEGATSEEEAKVAVSALLDVQHGVGTEDRELFQRELDDSEGEVGKWWFATGHIEGQMITDEDPPAWHHGVRLAPPRGDGND